MEGGEGQVYYLVEVLVYCVYSLTTCCADVVSYLGEGYLYVWMDTLGFRLLGLFTGKDLSRFWHALRGLRCF